MKSYNLFQRLICGPIALRRRASLGSNPRTTPRPQASHRDPNVFPRDPIWGGDLWVETRWHRHLRRVNCGDTATTFNIPAAAARSVYFFTPGGAAPPVSLHFIVFFLLLFSSFQPTTHCTVLLSFIKCSNKSKGMEPCWCCTDAAPRSLRRLEPPSLGQGRAGKGRAGKGRAGQGEAGRGGGA